MTHILVPEEPDFSIHAAIRSLARKGYSCDAASHRGALIRRLKKGRCINRLHLVASSVMDPEGYVADLRKICSAGKTELLIPFYYESYTALVPRQKLLAGLVQFLFPEPEQFEIANDKLLTARHCRKIGVPCPETLEIRDEGDLRSFSQDALFPVVLKLRSESSTKGVFMAPTAADLMRSFEDLCARFGKGRGCLVQEFIPGYIHDACTLSESGNVLQVLTQVRKLMLPVEGGVGAVNFTTDNPFLAATARKILQSLNWSGPAMLEFKFDERDRTYKLIEINPKFWGTLDLSRKAGIDFPSLLCDLLLGRSIPVNRPYPAGVRYQFLISRGILAHLQMLNAAGMRRLRDPQKYLRTHYDLDLLDPLPELMRAAGTIRALAFQRFRHTSTSLPLNFINPLDRDLPNQYPASSSHLLGL